MADTFSDAGDLSGEEESQEEDVMTPAELIARLEEAWLNEKFSPELLENKSELVECVMEQLTHMEENLQRVRKGDLKASVHRMEIDRIRFVLSSYLRSRLQKIEKFFPHVLEKEKSRADGDPSFLSPEEFAFAKEYLANTEVYLKAVALKHMPPNLQNVDMLKADAETLAHAFISSRLDHCNALFHGLPSKTLRPLQYIQNSAARVLVRTKKSTYITPIPLQLHWLPVTERIHYRVLLLTFKALHRLAPTYLSALLHPYVPSLPEPCLDSFVFLRVKERQENILVEPETDEQREYVVDLEEGSQHLMRYRTIAPLVASGAVQLI
ncbi:hypothetical protein NFI96_020029 [Prochilodus magdalenae]|nr:hypothetical protein NFI96_020029 [Prochilodus magdalenae]